MTLNEESHNFLLFNSTLCSVLVQLSTLFLLPETEACACAVDPSPSLNTLHQLLPLLLLLSLLSSPGSFFHGVAVLELSLILSWSIMGDTCGHGFTDSFSKYKIHTLSQVLFWALGIHEWTRQRWTHIEFTF